MKTHSFTTRVESRSDVFYFCPIGDVHEDSLNSDIEGIKQTVKWVKGKPNVYWMGMGDMGDYITYADKRYDPLSHRQKRDSRQIYLEKQVERIADMFDPIKDRCIGILEGNHEKTIRLRNQIDVTTMLADKLNTTNLSYTTLIRWVFDRVGGGVSTIKIYASHGYGTAKSGINRLKEKATYFDADIYIMGHGHGKEVAEAPKLYISTKGTPKLLEKKQLFGLTGTFLKCYEDGVDGYGETSGYNPTSLGVIKVTIEPFREQKGCTVPHLHISL